MKIFKSILLINCFLLLACGGDTTTQITPTKKSSVAETASKNESVQKKKSVIFFGDSLSAGYGLDPSESFPALIQNKINDKKINYKVVNAGLSGETTAGGVGRIDWVLRQPVDVFILELGGNDMLRGVAVKETYKNLTTIVERVQKNILKQK